MALYSSKAAGVTKGNSSTVNKTGGSASFAGKTSNPAKSTLQKQQKSSPYDVAAMVSGGSSNRSLSDGGGGGGGGGSDTPIPTEPDGGTGGTPGTPTTPDYAALRSAALQDALQYGTTYAQTQGFHQPLVDQYGVMDQYRAALEEQLATLGDKESYDGLLSRDNFIRDAADNATGRYRTDMRNSLNAVAPEGFENTAFADTMDDPILNAILAQQRNDAQLTLDRSRARGSLNDVGYGRANNALGDQAKAGLSSLQQLGGGVLAEYRKQLGDTRATAATRIGSADIRNPYDVNTATARLQELRNGYQGSLENDLYRTVGGQKFFDTSSAVAKGGQVQGTINPSRVNPNGNPLFAAFGEDERRRTFSGNNSGSTATTGAF